MKTWVKLYTEIIDDPDQADLTWAQRGVWSALLALAGKLDDRDAQGRETGRLDTAPRVAWYLRCDLVELLEALAKFEQLGMVEKVDGVVCLPNFRSRQERMPSEDPAAVRERVTRHRQKCNEQPAQSVTTCNESVTSGKRDVTGLDTDTDTDTERESEERESARETGDAPAAPTPTLPQPVRPVVHSARDRLQTPAGNGDPPALMPVTLKQIYHNALGVWLDTPILEAISKAVTDPSRFREVCEAWALRGYKPRNVEGVLDWYRNGIPAAGPPGRNGGNGHGPADQATREQYAAGASVAKASESRLAGRDPEAARLADAWERAQVELRGVALQGVFAGAEALRLDDDGKVVVGATEKLRELLATAQTAVKGRRALAQAEQLGVRVDGLAEVAL